MPRQGSSRNSTAAALLLLAHSCMPAAAAEIAGKRPHVVDGDTIVLAGVVIELAGIDAPEPDQVCRRGGTPWTCGADARWALIDRIGFNWVVCMPQAQTADGALSAICALGGVGGPELNAWLVAKGWALADRHAGHRYFDEEAEARGAGRGLWAGSFDAPWDWRAGVRRVPP